MSLALNNIKNKPKNRKRVGRGNASGHGTYSCRGLKGQRSRSGGKGGLKLKGFKQNLLNMPKFAGMKTRFAKAQIVLLSTLDKNFSDGDKVTPGSLLKKGLIDTISKKVKILAHNEKDNITKKLEIIDCNISATAEEKIVKAGGRVVDVLDEKEDGTKQEKTK